MKAIVCGRCVDIRALPPEGEVECRCGNVAARWVDPQAGTVEITKALEPRLVRMLGVHNSFLKWAFTEDTEHPTYDQWQARHDLVTDSPLRDDVPGSHNARSYADERRFSGESLFGYAKRRCWAILFKVGETGDVRWGVRPSASSESATTRAEPLPEWFG